MARNWIVLVCLLFCSKFIFAGECQNAIGHLGLFRQGHPAGLDILHIKLPRDRKWSLEFRSPLQPALIENYVQFLEYLDTSEPLTPGSHHGAFTFTFSHSTQEIVVSHYGDAGFAALKEQLLAQNFDVKLINRDDTSLYDQWVLQGSETVTLETALKELQAMGFSKFYLHAGVSGIFKRQSVVRLHGLLSFNHGIPADFIAVTPETALERASLLSKIGLNYPNPRANKKLIPVNVDIHYETSSPTTYDLYFSFLRADISTLYFDR